MNRRLLIPFALAAAVAFPGTAHANANTADADCDGVTFNMPKGEADTVVTTTLDGRVVRTDVIATFGAPLTFRVPSNDLKVAHVWAITVDSRWNEDTFWTETVPACVAPTTLSTTTTSTTVPNPTTTTSTTLPNPSTTVVNPTTTTSVVNPSSTTVITTPRPGTTIPPTSVPPFRLPDTGGENWEFLAFGAVAFVVGVLLRRLVERS